MTDIKWLDQPIQTLNQQAYDQGLERQAQLTKPPGALGRLETLATRLCAMQGMVKPSVDNCKVVVFAADHGIAQAGVSAFPQAVTAEMIKNFAHGGAAITALARQHQASFEVVNLGVVVDLPALPHLVDATIMPGTHNFAEQAAMSHDQLSQALWVGKQAADRANDEGAKIFVGGDMGIGNTTAATALLAWVTKQEATLLAGPGTGLDTAGVTHKGQIIASALNKHVQEMTNPLAALRYVGGLEIAALVGAYIRCAQLGVGVLVDGFIASAAALMAAQIQPKVTEWMFFSHASAEPAHQHMLAALQAQPLLDLGMRLGEGSGAMVALSILKSACCTHNEMATFAEAAVSEKNS